MSRLAILNWKQLSARRRDFRHTRGGPEVYTGPKHRRKAGGCKKAWDGEHVEGQPQIFNFSVGDDDLGYRLYTCTLCFKKRYEWN